MTYRDANAAFAERIEALEAENAELRAEIARLRGDLDRRRVGSEPPRLPPNVARLETEVVNLRAENELLRGEIERNDAATTDAKRLREQVDALTKERDKLAKRLDGAAVARLRKEITHLEAALANAKDKLDAESPPPLTDNRDAVIGRLREEVDELRDELHRLRNR